METVNPASETAVVLGGPACPGSVLSFLDPVCRLTGVSVRRLKESGTEAGSIAGLRNPFCALLEQTPGWVVLCRRAHAEAGRQAHHTGRPVPIQCPFGLTMVAIPIVQADGSVGALLVGEVLLGPPQAEQFDQAFAGHTQTPDLSALWAAYRRTPVLSPEQFEALTHVFELATRPLLPPVNGRSGQGPPCRQPCAPADTCCGCVHRARQVIAERFREKLTLTEVAREVGVSPWHLSRLFKSQTGVTFRQHLTDARVAGLKRLLLESDIPITSAIFDAGFQSISQANRVFRSAAGLSPSGFRAQSGAGR